MNDSKESKKAIVGATLIDGTGKDAVSDSVVLIDGDKISEVGPKGEVNIPPEADLMEVDGSYLLPGFIDLHVHIYHAGFVPIPPKGSDLAYAGIIAMNNLRSALQAGITTIRDVSDKTHVNLAMRTAERRGLLVAPRLFVAGKGVCITGGHGSGGGSGLIHEVDSPAEVRKAIREEIKVAGVDFIKLLTSHRTDNPEFSLEEIKAGVEESHRLGRKVAIHAANKVAVRMSAEAGVDTIEHGTFLDEESAEICSEKDITLVPTLWVKNYMAELLGELKEDVHLRREFQMDEDDVETSLTWFSRCVDQLPNMMEAARSKGVRIGAGTDCVMADKPFAMLPEEIEHLAKYGLSNMEAIEAATRHGAEAIGKEDEFGTIEPGKYADMIVLEKNPLEDISAVKDVSFVMKEGEEIQLHPEWRKKPISAPQQTT